MGCEVQRLFLNTRNAAKKKTEICNATIADSAVMGTTTWAKPDTAGTNGEVGQDLGWLSKSAYAVSYI